MPARLSAAATLTLAGKPRAPSRAVPSNTFRGGVEAFERNAALDQIRRAVEPARRLARDHGDRMDGAFGGGAHGIEPDQRAGRHQDARAGFLGPRHQIPVLQKLADGQRHEQLAALDGRCRHGAEQRRRQAFDHQVAGFGKRFGGDDGNARRRPAADCAWPCRRRAPRRRSAPGRECRPRSAAPRRGRPRRAPPIRP